LGENVYFRDSSSSLQIYTSFPNCTIMKYMKYLLLPVFTLLCAFGTVPAVSQTLASPKVDTVRITAALLAKGFDLDSVRFRFHAGDDMRWKEPAFNDSAWQLVRNDTAGNLLPTGIGWFRTYLRAAPDVVPTIATFRGRMFFGAADIFLDGKLIQRLGTASAVAEQEEMQPFTYQPTHVFINLSDTTTHVLAVRVSRWSLPVAQTWFGLMQSVRTEIKNGISVTIRQPQAVTKRLVGQLQSTVLSSIACGLMLLIFLLQGYLYLLNRQDKMTLYFALAVLGLLVFDITGFIFDYAAFSPVFFIVNEIVQFITGAFATVFLFCGVQTYFAKPIPVWYAVLIGILALANIMLLFFVGDEAISYGPLVLLCAEVIRSTWVHVFRNRTDTNAWILGIGVSSPCLLPLLFLVEEVVGKQLVSDEIFTFLLFATIPISITFVLVRRVTEDRARLARYSQDLERDVAERTTDLQTANEEISRQMDVQTEQAREIELANTMLQEKNVEVELAREQSESLLLNILPAPIAHRLKSGERAIADRFDSVTVLFADIVGFTKLSAQTTPEELVQGLNAIFGRFDALAKHYALEKIKTIGDAYMVAGGLPERTDENDHTERVARFALDILAAMGEETLRTSKGETVQLRIGIHTGEAVAGVIGTSKFSYDLWGDTVNTASRMESHSEPGKIHVSPDVYAVLKDTFIFEERGEVEVKGKGAMQTWFLTGARPQIRSQSAS
jgi:class 3 adenylate cyclase